jgi:aconitase B
MENVKMIAPQAGNIYRYLNFHEIAAYQAIAKKVADKVIPIVGVIVSV